MEASLALWSHADHLSTYLECCTRKGLCLVLRLCGQACSRWVWRAREESDVSLLWRSLEKLIKARFSGTHKTQGGGSNCALISTADCGNRTTKFPSQIPQPSDGDSFCPFNSVCGVTFTSLIFFAEVQNRHEDWWRIYWTEQSTEWPYGRIFSFNVCNLSVLEGHQIFPQHDDRR